MVNLSTLKKNPKNPRVIRDIKFESLKTSITEFPQMMKLRPIVIDDKRMILGGNMRYEALLALNYKQVPDDWVIKASKLTEEQKKRFIITDNAPFGEWDWDMLGNEWEAQELEKWGLDVPQTFEPPDLNEFVGEDDERISKGRIVLEYTEDEGKLVREKLAKVDETPEKAVWKLLKL